MKTLLTSFVQDESKLQQENDELNAFNGYLDAVKNDLKGDNSNTDN